MARPIRILPGDGELIGDSPVRRVEILSDDDSLNATWSRWGPHRRGADLHVHRAHTDLFYVLQGELTVRRGVADERVAVPAGTLVRIPPLVVHGFNNDSDGELRYLNFHAPGRRFNDYLRASRDGREFSYDQFEPGTEDERPPADAVIGEREFVADRPGTELTLLADVDEIGVAEVRSDPDAPSPPRHLHRDHVESFYVLEGSMWFEAGGDRLAAPAGTWVQIPRGVAHTFGFDGDGQVRFLNLHTPSRGFGRFVRALQEARDDGELAAARAAFDQADA